MSMVTVVGSIAMINQVHITEVIVGVVATMAELAMSRVAGSWGTGLDVTVAIGAEHKGLGITVVQTIIVALAIVLAPVGVTIRGSSIGHHGEEDEDLHVSYDNAGDQLMLDCANRGLYIPFLMSQFVCL
jgi:hypothetical protein